jgi:hypothetical protein
MGLQHSRFLHVRSIFLEPLPMRPGSGPLNSSSTLISPWLLSVRGQQCGSFLSRTILRLPAA